MIQTSVSCDRNMMGIAMVRGEGLDDFEVFFDPLTGKQEMVTVVHHDL